MDQLASIGVEFDEATITRIFTRLERTYIEMDKDKGKGKAKGKSKERNKDGTTDKYTSKTLPTPPPITSDHPNASSEEPDSDFDPFCGALALVKKMLPSVKPWAIEAIYESNLPVRPWGLGALIGSQGTLAKIVGYNLRAPGLYRKTDRNTGQPTKVYLEDTNERIHSSVRIRLAMKGLGLNDSQEWVCPALKGKWQLKKTMEQFEDPIPTSLSAWDSMDGAAASVLPKGAPPPPGVVEPGAEVAINEDGVAMPLDLQRPLSVVEERQYRWVWEYCGPEKEAPPERIMVEEPLGPFERQLLRLAGGQPNVYEFAEAVKIDKL